VRLVFSGLERPVSIEPGSAATLQVGQPALFSRIVESLISTEGRYAVEPYTFWDADKELAPKDVLLIVLNPFALPWDDRALMGQIIKKIERDMIADEDIRILIEEAEQAFASRLISLTGCLSADYSFGVEWDLPKSLKMLGFGAAPAAGTKLVDNLIAFLSLALDAGFKKGIAFVNLKTFLTKKEFDLLLEHVFYTKLNVLFLENKIDTEQHEYERKYVVDQHFLEY
jgi:CRISPR-associated protein Csn2